MAAAYKVKPDIGTALSNKVVLRDFLNSLRVLDEYTKSTSEKNFLIDKIVEKILIYF